MVLYKQSTTLNFSQTNLVVLTSASLWREKRCSNRLLQTFRSKGGFPSDGYFLKFLQQSICMLISLWQSTYLIDCCFQLRLEDFDLIWQKRSLFRPTSSTAHKLIWRSDTLRPGVTWIELAIISISSYFNCISNMLDKYMGKPMGD